MKKRLTIFIAAIALVALAIPTSAVMAAANDAPTTVFACLEADGVTVDPATITVDQPPTCPDGDFSTSWNVQGPKGDAGSDGKNGNQGNPGKDGTDGAQGPVGPIGLTGPQGDPGKDGTNGTDGKDGVQGPKGDPGVAGPAGPSGAQGAPGISGYVVVYSPNVTLNPGQIESANCPAGDVALGGGVQLGNMGSNFAIVLSRISTPHHAWQGAYNSVNGTKTTIQVSAICAKVAA